MKRLLNRRLSLRESTSFRGANGDDSRRLATRHLLILASLLGVSAAIQVWCIAHAVVPAQDAVRHANVATEIEREGLLAVLRDREEQPLFPVAVWLTRQWGRHLACQTAWTSTVGPEGLAGWEPAPLQIAAAVPLVLAVLPLYGFLLCLVRAPAAAAGTLFFCVTTAAARLGADGLNDSTHLCLWCVALWAIGRCFTGSHSPGWLFAAGLAIAAAALARKEALILIPAVGLALLLFQVRPSWRQSWTRAATAGLCLGLGVAVVLAPYLIAADAVTPRHAVARLLGKPRPSDSPSAQARTSNRTKRRSSRWRTEDGQRMSFVKKDPRASLRFHGYAAAILEFARELPKAFHYWFGAAALLGVWTARRRLPRRVDAFALILFLIYSLAAIHFAARAGYLSPRHLLPVLVLGIGWSGEGILLLGRHLRALCQHGHSSFVTRRFSFVIRPALVLLAAAACLPQTLTPLHGSRLGHYQAAQWLSAQPDPDGSVLDTRGWTSFYTGRTTYALPQAKQALRDARLSYIVLERLELEYDSRRGQTLRELLARAGELVARFPGHQPAAKEVEVYRWHPARFAKRQPRRLAN